MPNVSKIVITAILLATLAFAQSRPLPDASTLLNELQQNQRKLDTLRRNYVCTDDEEEYDLDKSGNTKKIERRQFEMFFSDGFQIRRLLSKEGVPLNDHDRKKEDERVAKEEKKARERQAKIDRGDEKEKLTVAQFLQTSRFKNLRFEQYKDHEVIAMNFEPNSDYHPHGTEESLVNKLSGTIWIDEQAHQVVRLEARLVKGQGFGLGLASLKEGSAFVFEQQRINDELWMPASSDANFGARVVFTGINKRVVEHFSNYKKFKTDTKIVGVQEVK